MKQDSLERSQSDLKKLRRKSQGKNANKYENKESEVRPGHTYTHTRRHMTHTSSWCSLSDPVSIHTRVCSHMCRHNDAYIQGQTLTPEMHHVKASVTVVGAMCEVSCLCSHAGDSCLLLGHFVCPSKMPGCNFPIHHRASPACTLKKVDAHKP